MLRKPNWRETRQKLKFVKMTSLMLGILGLGMANSPAYADDSDSAPPPPPTACCTDTTQAVVNLQNDLDANLFPQLFNDYLSKLLTPVMDYSKITNMTSPTDKPSNWVTKDAGTYTSAATMLAITNANPDATYRAFSAFVPQVYYNDGGSINADKTNQDRKDKAPYLTIATIFNNPGMQAPDTPFDPSTFFDNNGNVKNLPTDAWSEANIFIQSLAGGGSPIKPLSSTELDPDTYNDGVVPVTKYQYQALLGLYGAQLSVGLNSMYRLLASRKIQPGLGTAMGLQDKPDISPHQAETIMASRRLSPEWLKSIIGNEQDGYPTPADMQRQMLIIMAEMRYEQYRNRMQLEQLNATLATLEIQMAGATKMMATMARQTATSIQAAQDAFKNASVPPPADDSN